jgi:hypothetical protein
MIREIGTGTVLVKNDALLPKGFQFESDSYTAGWKMISDTDGYGLNRAIQKAGWTYFCLAGEVKTTVFGIDNQNMLRRAIERMLARGKSDGFNSLEITRVTSVGSERFPLVRYVTVSAKWRHVQESMFLSRGNRGSGAAKKIALADASTRTGSDRATHSGGPANRSGAISRMNL